MSPSQKAAEILVKIEAAGFYGTDRHLFKGEFPSTVGSTLGHEFCGIVLERGSKVSIRIGSRMTCDPNIWCGECEQCRRGRENICKNNIAIGIQRDGGFAQYCAFPKSKHIFCRPIFIPTTERPVNL